MPSLDRLRRMTLAEFSCRSRQQAAKWIDRVTPASGPFRAVVRSDDPNPQRAAIVTDGFARKAPVLFVPEIAGLIDARWPDHRADVIDRADRIRQRRFSLLGYEDLSFGTPVDWQFDPIAGRRAPRTHWSRIDPLDPDQVGDSKVQWELSRHQWLVTLAQAYRLSGDDAYAQAGAELLAEWLDANPHGRGVNWTSSLEAAFRLIAWSWTLAMLNEPRLLARAPFATLALHVREHARYVERYLSHFFSPNTHLTGEALGLFYAGVLFEGLAESARWRDLGRDILIEQCERQILSDGVYIEQATCYQRYTIEIYSHFLLLARRFGVAVPERIVDRVRRAVEFLRHVCDAEGQLPAIGDADSGWVLPLARRGHQDCRGVLGLAEAVLADPSAGADVPEVAWLCGRIAPARNSSQDASAETTPSSRLFAQGGYAVMRSGAGESTRTLIVDVGPLGCQFSGAHGHADLLSLHLTAFSETWIRDSGTGTYRADLRWRAFFRSTAAHSTVSVDSRGQAEPTGPFAWRTRPSARVRAWTSTESTDAIDAEHDAYADLPDPVRHRRRVLFVKPDFWVVVDDLYGLAVHDIEVRFQLTTAPALGANGAAWVGRCGRGLWIVPFSTTPLSSMVRQGSTDPIDGWHSPAYGKREPAPVLIYRATAHLPLRIATLLRPMAVRSDDAPVVEPVWSANDGQLEGLMLPAERRLIRFDAGTIGVEALPCAAS